MAYLQLPLKLRVDGLQLHVALLQAATGKTASTPNETGSADVSSTVIVKNHHVLTDVGWRRSLLLHSLTYLQLLDVSEGEEVLTEGHQGAVRWRVVLRRREEQGRIAALLARLVDQPEVGIRTNRLRTCGWGI